LLLRVGSLQLGEQARIDASGGGATTGSTYGGGGGGRVALYYEELLAGSLADQVIAKGGLSQHAEPGAAGTVYLKNTQSGEEELILNNTGVPTTAPEALLDVNESFAGKITLINVVAKVVGDLQVDRLTAINSQVRGIYRNSANELVVDGFSLELPSSGSWSKVRVLNGGVITTPVASDSFTQGITIAADEIEVDAASRISVASRGLLPSADIGFYCGGSHGGSGGRYNSCSTNAVYGDYLQPTTFGTGGKQGSHTSSLTRGGGALKLVAQVIKLDGQLLATGESGKSGYTWGGGAGGSLWLDTQLLLGGASTRILANGGTGGTAGGPGGGGRIAIYYAGMQGIDPVSQISVAPGTANASSTPGGQGSLHLENRVVSTAVLNADVAGHMSRAVSAITVDFINAVDPASISNSTVRLFGPAGEVPFSAISAVNTVRYQFELGEALTDGSYELRVGPGVRSAQGMGMDQNGNGVADEPGDVFVHSSSTSCCLRLLS
jgi:hypothetical protein